MNSLSPNTWRELNKRIQENLSSETKVFVYPGVHHALFEICLGLHIRLPQRRKIVCQTGFGDHLRHTEIELAKLGVRFKHTFDESMEQEEKGTLAYIHDFDDSLTGELYDHSDTFKKLATTRIHRIHVAHQLFLFKKSIVQNIGELDIVICGLNDKYALVFAGDKVALPTLTAGQLPWHLESDYSAISQLLNKNNKELQSDILKFEANLPNGVEAWFVNSRTHRLFDRAVVTVKNQDGAALQELLAEELGLTLGSPGEAAPIESPSFCRWANEVWFDQGQKFNRSREQIQGMVLISGETLSPDFSKAFLGSLEKLKKLTTP